MYEPINNRVLIEEIDAPKKTPGGLVLPENTRGAQKVKKATVIAVGPGNMLENGGRAPMAVKIGDVVLFSGEYLNPEVKDGEHTYLLVFENELLAIER